MKTEELSQWATDKNRFNKISDFIDFAKAFCEFRDNQGFQAEIVARNNTEYRFFQFSEEANFQISRPVNSSLFYAAEEFESASAVFLDALYRIAHGEPVNDEHRDAINRVIYSCQQSIGILLDSIPSSKTNTARKINGDLFERFISLIIQSCGVECRTGELKVPVLDDSGNQLFEMKYQHDLMIESEGELKAIGSVKTSSKDRISKVFIDKFLYNKLTNVDIPHFAIFLNDVQRVGKLPNFRTGNTFLPGHFKGYTVKLNPLDGVYYCDLLPSMKSDSLLADHISQIDTFFVDDLKKFIHSENNGE